MTINCNGKLLDLSQPVVMGILNVTPDSFYDGGKYTEEEKIYRRVKQILDEGAEIIDVGAYSSRPGAEDVPPEKELKRLAKALDVINKHFPGACISVDTFRAEIAKYVVENHGVGMINDIMGGADEKMFETIARLQVPYVLMHIKGTPQTMQNNPVYDDVVAEIIAYLSEKTDKLRYLGVNDIIIDPGFGFGKTIDHNYQILKHLDEFKIFEMPLLVGISRKSMIYKYLGITPAEALPGTIALNTVALLKGANILRVHDVAETKQTIAVVNKLLQVKNAH